jgi:hypothetical protein
MKKQKIDPENFGEDCDKTFALAPRDVRNLAFGMHKLVAEIRRFSK